MGTDEQETEDEQNDLFINYVELLKQSTNISSMGVHVVDLHTREMYYSNDAGFRLLDMEPCEYRGRTCHEVFFGSDQPCINCRLEQTKQGEQRHEVYVQEAGKTFLTNSQIAAWGGKEVYIEFITDISKDKEIERRLRESERELEEKYEIEKQKGRLSTEILAHSIFNISADKPIELNLNQLIVPGEASTSLQEIAQIESVLIIDEEQKQEYLALHHSESLMKRYEKGETEITLDLRCKLPTGRVCWIRDVLHMLRQPNETDILLFEYTQDVNKSKSLDIMMDFAVNDEYDMLGSVNFDDNSAVMLYGKESYNAFDETLIEEDYDVSLERFSKNAVDPAEKEAYLSKAAIQNVRKMLAQQNSYEFYFHMLKDDVRKTKKVRYMFYGKRKDACLFIQSDITEVLEAQQKKQDELRDALESAELANHYKSIFLSQMSHEIRTPMNAIIGMARLAADTENITEKDEYIQKIVSSSDYLLGIINDILDMSRIENGKFELHASWCTVYDILMSCINMLLPEMKKKEINFIYPHLNPDNGIEYYVDKLRMRQIYMNLLNNAVKFTPKGGTICMKIKNIDYDETTARDLIEISDTGCGMSEEFLQRIFQPFEQEQNPFSTQVQGTGLGLALVKQIITAMGGEVQVESKLGKGSTFSFIVPYEYRKAEKTAKRNYSSEEVNLKGKRVLLAEDHPMNQEIATKLLEREGMLVELACNGQEAVEKFKQSEPDYYQIILMDIRMPVMNGLQAVKAIRALDRADARTIPVIAMTANAFDDDVKASLEAGMDSHLTKPIEVEKMFATIRKYCRKGNQ